MALVLTLLLESAKVLQSPDSTFVLVNANNIHRLANVETKYSNYIVLYSKSIIIIVIILVQSMMLSF